MCNKTVRSAPQSKYCGEHHRWKSWWLRTVRRTAEAEMLPLASLPPDAEEVLPNGPERLLVATQMVLIGRAPASACGYRLGIRPGRSLIMRWFPAVRLFPAGMFRLEPFEWPVVPARGTYAVVYMDRHFMPIGGPRFSIAVDTIDSRLRVSDGDRTYKPRPRTE